MTLKIDKAGRIVVPKSLRERLGFNPNTALEAIENLVQCLDGCSLPASGR
jgi:AbrB family looped-hinge helix DNA binding protein